MEEEWRGVADWDRYEVSNLGQLRRINLATAAYTPKYTVRKLQCPSATYANVGLSQDGRSKTIQIHVLVLETFVGPRPKGLVCNHKNGDKFDNRLENLEWITQSANALHAYQVLGRVSVKGAQVGGSVFTEADVISIRSMYIGGTSFSEISRAFGSDPGTIRGIVRGDSWKHVPYASTQLSRKGRARKVS